MRHPLPLLTREVPPLELRLGDSCLLLQDLHAPFADPEQGWLARRARAKVLGAEFSEYFRAVRELAPNVVRLLAAARGAGLTVLYSCFGFRPPASPSPLQAALGWEWDLAGPEGRFPPALEPVAGEGVYPRPGWGALSEPGLARFLQERSIRSVVLVGTLLDFGLRHSCWQLADQGVGSLVVSDAVAPLTLAGEACTHGNLACGLTKFRTTAELLDLLPPLAVGGVVRI